MSDKLITVDNPTKTINIDLSDYPEYEEHFKDSKGLSLNLSKQRYFHKKIEEFRNDLYKAFLEVDGFLELFIQINEVTYNSELYDYDGSNYLEFVDFLHENMCTEELKEYIHNMVEESYDINIEGEHKVEDHSTSSPSVILQFTNAYAKRIICIGVMARLFFPLLCTFITVKGLNKDLEVKIFLEAINKIIKEFNYDDEGNKIDLAAKIQKFVQISVDNTLYSDKVIWKYLSNQNITSHSLAKEINDELFTRIIPKLEQNRSIVSFFHVFIKNKIQFQFTSKFALSYKPIEKVVTDDDSVNPFVRIEQRLLKTSSELDSLMVKLDINKFLDMYDNLSDEDLEYHLNNVTIHTMQTRILNSFIMMHLGFGIHIYSLTKSEYIRFLFIARDWFEENNFSYIPYILLGSPIEEQNKILINGKPRRNINRGKNLVEITSSKIYQDVLKKYRSVGDKIDDSVILSFVNDIVNTDFDFYTMPDGTVYSCEATAPNNVVVEVLNYIKIF